jgi:hypothetical protein
MGTASAGPFWVPTPFIRLDDLPRRPHHSNLAIRCDYETPTPATDVLVLEYFLDAPDKALTVRRAESNEQDAVMCSGSKSPKVGEVQVLGDEESRIALRRFPNVAVAPAT